MKSALAMFSAWCASTAWRSVGNLLEVIEDLTIKGAHFRSLRNPLDTSTPQGMFSLQVLGAVAQLERALIFRTNEVDYRGGTEERKAARQPGNARAETRGAREDGNGAKGDVWYQGPIWDKRVATNGAPNAPSPTLGECCSRVEPEGIELGAAAIEAFCQMVAEGALR